jgi:hypothetical protein
MQAAAASMISAAGRAEVDIVASMTIIIILF